MLTSARNSPVILSHIHRQVSAWASIIGICGVHAWAQAWQQHSSGKEEGLDPQFKYSSQEKVRESLAEASFRSFFTAV